MAFSTLNLATDSSAIESYVADINTILEELNSILSTHGTNHSFHPLFQRNSSELKRITRVVVTGYTDPARKEKALQTIDAICLDIKKYGDLLTFNVDELPNIAHRVAMAMMLIGKCLYYPVKFLDGKDKYKLRELLAELRMLNDQIIAVMHAHLEAEKEGGLLYSLIQKIRHELEPIFSDRGKSQSIIRNVLSDLTTDTKILDLILDKKQEISELKEKNLDKKVELTPSFKKKNSGIFNHITNWFTNRLKDDSKENFTVEQLSYFKELTNQANDYWQNDLNGIDQLPSQMNTRDYFDRYITRHHYIYSNVLNAFYAISKPFSWAKGTLFSRFYSDHSQVAEAIPSEDKLIESDDIDDHWQIIQAGSGLGRLEGIYALFSEFAAIHPAVKLDFLSKDNLEIFAGDAKTYDNAFNVLLPSEMEIIGQGIKAKTEIAGELIDKKLPAKETIRSFSSALDINLAMTNYLNAVAKMDEPGFFERMGERSGQKNRASELKKQWQQMRTYSHYPAAHLSNMMLMLDKMNDYLQFARAELHTKRVVAESKEYVEMMFFDLENFVAAERKKLVEAMLARLRLLPSPALSETEKLKDDNQYSANVVLDMLEALQDIGGNKKYVSGFSAMRTGERYILDKKMILAYKEAINKYGDVEQKNRLQFLSSRKAESDLMMEKDQSSELVAKVRFSSVNVIAVPAKIKGHYLIKLVSTDDSLENSLMNSEIIMIGSEPKEEEKKSETDDWQSDWVFVPRDELSEDDFEKLSIVYDETYHDHAMSQFDGQQFTYILSAKEYKEIEDYAEKYFSDNKWRQYFIDLVIASAEKMAEKRLTLNQVMDEAFHKTAEQFIEESNNLSQREKAFGALLLQNKQLHVPAPFDKQVVVVLKRAHASYIKNSFSSMVKDRIGPPHLQTITAYLDKRYENSTEMRDADVNMINAIAALSAALIESKNRLKICVDAYCENNKKLSLSQRFSLLAKHQGWHGEKGRENAMKHWQLYNEEIDIVKFFINRLPKANNQITWPQLAVAYQSALLYLATDAEHYILSGSGGNRHAHSYKSYVLAFRNNMLNKIDEIERKNIMNDNILQDSSMLTQFSSRDVIFQLPKGNIQDLQNSYHDVDDTYDGHLSLLGFSEQSIRRRF